MATTEQYASHHIPPGKYRRPGQSKESFKKIINVATTTTMLVEPDAVVQSELPAADVAGTSGYIPTANFTCARLLFAGVGSANNQVHYQVVLWYPGPTVSGADELTYIPLVIAKGTARLGANTYSTNDMGATGTLWADMIIDTRGHSGVFVNSPEDDSKAWIDVDLHNASGIEVEVDRVGNTTTDVLLQFGEVPASAVGGWVAPSLAVAGPNEMYIWLDGATGSTALADATPVAALPTMATATAGTTGGIYTEGNRHATITFGGVGAGGTINYQVIGWKEIRAVAGATQCYWPEKIAAGEATLGTATYTADEIGAGTELICDAMTEVTNHMRAFVQPAIDNEVCSLHLDITNFLAIEVETDLGTATACDVIGQLGSNPAPFDSVSVVGQSEDTETSSLHGKIGTDTEMGDISLWDLLVGDGPGTFPAGATAANDVSIAEVIRYIEQTVLGGANDATNTSLHGKIGTATEMGTTSLFNMLVGAQKQYVVATISMSASTTGDEGEHYALTVTGLVEMWIVVEATSTLTDNTNGATIVVGTLTTGDIICGQGSTIDTDECTTGMLLPSDGADIPAADYLVQAGDEDCMAHVISNEVDVTYTIAGEDVTGGGLKFHCAWRPLEANATVAAAGGADV